MHLPEDIVQELISETRLNVVRSTMMFGTEPELVFDRIAAMASLALSAPVAQVTLLDSETQWFKASHGIDLQQAPTETSFCSFTLRDGGQSVISPDTRKDERFKNNPFVVEPPHVSFYAGAPIKLDQQVIGTVCVYDMEPKDEVSAQAVTSLEHLADITSEFISAYRTYAGD